MWQHLLASPQLCCISLVTLVHLLVRFQVIGRRASTARPTFSRRYEADVRSIVPLDMHVLVAALTTMT